MTGYYMECNKGRNITTALSTRYLFQHLTPTFKLNPADIYLFKVNSKTMWNLFKAKIKTLERGHRRRSGVLIVNFEQISPIALVFPLPTLNK